MNSVIAFKGQPVEKAPAALNDRLVWLTRFGKPRVSFTGSGWRAIIEMHVADAVKGAQFEVASEFGRSSPDAAVAELTERMLEALAKLGTA